MVFSNRWGSISTRPRTSHYAPYGYWFSRLGRHQTQEEEKRENVEKWGVHKIIIIAEPGARVDAGKLAVPSAARPLAGATQLGRCRAERSLAYLAGWKSPSGKD